MIDLHTQEVLEEIRDSINNYLEESEGTDSGLPEEAEDLLVEILDKLAPLLERDI
jgi:hypothetical protein